MHYEGTLSKIVAAGYQFVRDPDAPIEATVSTDAEVVVEANVHVAEKEREEAPIPASSLGSTPYIFWLKMAGWRGSLLCGVSTFLRAPVVEMTSLFLGPFCTYGICAAWFAGESP
jgi:hypothetical protein